ncbi:MAG: histidine phosphatase family protein [Ilumatobacteraceae bacterium]|jgi:broad specificity phosphatase PhoE
MPRLHLVRHGRAAAGWNVDPDPALDDLGRRQALDVVEKLARLGPLPVLSSPLLRCRETSQPLAVRWGVDVIVEPRVAEIPSPEGHTLETRIEWLRAVMAGTWSQVITSDGPRYASYRDELLGALASLPNDTVVFSHFIAINVVIGAATADDRMVIASLDNCSVTTVTSDGRGKFTIDAVGNEADTLIR